MEAARPSFPPPVLQTTWPPPVQWATAALGLAALGLLLVRLYEGSPRADRPCEIEEPPRTTFRLDLNEAAAAELAQIPGLGPALAERVVAERQAHGPFRSVGELRRVKGIGPFTLVRVRPWLAVEGASDEDPPDLAAVDVNTAPVEELRRLPGLTAKQAQAICDERARAPFVSVDDLRRVHGLGPKTLERLRGHVRAGAAPEDEDDPDGPP